MSSDAVVVERKLNKLAWALSAVVLLLVGLMRAVRIPVPVDFGFLPPVHATLNALTAVALIAALVFIKRKQVAQHRAAIYTAIGLSVLFLLSYVVYHFTSVEVRFGDVDHNGVVDAAERAAVGAMRPVYLLLLVTHVVLAALILPFILLTFNRAFTAQYARHKAMARWVYPIWLYVAVSGPLCYWMLRPYYPLEVARAVHHAGHTGKREVIPRSGASDRAGLQDAIVHFARSPPGGPFAPLRRQNQGHIERAIVSQAR